MNPQLAGLAEAFHAEKVLKDCTHRKAIERSGKRGFELKYLDDYPDAPLSPFYLDLRGGSDGSLTEDTIWSCSQALYQKAMLAGLDYQYIVGLPRAGVTFAEQFPRTRNILGREVSLLHIDKKEMPDGKRRISGPVAGGNYRLQSVVLVIDDVITHADTKLEGIKVLEDSGFIVRDVLVIVDRQQGGKQRLVQAGYRLHALFTITELVEYYASLGYISPDFHRDILQYISQP